MGEIITVTVTKAIVTTVNGTTTTITTTSLASLVIDYAGASAFAAFGWIVVLSLLSFVLYRWFKSKRSS